MRFTRNLLVTLALAATTTPLVGCLDNADDADDAVDAVQLATADQAIEVGPAQVLQGVQAGFEIYKMIGTYQKYGKLTITTNDIFDKVTQVEEDVQALRAEVSKMQDAMLAAMLDVKGEISVVAAKNALAQVDAVMTGWVYANQNLASDPNALKTFYANLLAGISGGYGTIDLQTLLQLDAHAQAAITGHGAFLGTQGNDRAPELGIYAAGVRLRLAEGFFLLTLAQQDKGTPQFLPDGDAVKAQTARLAAFDQTFFTANDAMNRAIVAKEMQLRGARVLGCTKGDNNIYLADQLPGVFGLPSRSRSTQHSRGPAPADTAYIRNYSNEDGLMRACETFRTSYVAEQQAIWGSTKMGELLSSEQAFTAWSTASDAAGTTSTIHVEDAGYDSANRTSNVTAQLRSACDNRDTCAYTVDVGTLGDIDHGMAKAFSVSYRCGASPNIKTVSISAEANGQSVALQCAPISLTDMVGTWEDRGDAEAFAANPGLSAQVTVVDASTLRFSRGDGVAFSLIRTADPLVLDIGTDCIWYDLGWKTATLEVGPLGTVDVIRFPSGTYRLAH